MSAERDLPEVRAVGADPQPTVIPVGEPVVPVVITAPGEGVPPPVVAEAPPPTPLDLSTILDESANILRDTGTHKLTLGEAVVQDMVTREVAGKPDKVANANIEVKLDGETVVVGGSFEALDAPVIGGFKVTHMRWVIGNGEPTADGDGTLQTQALDLESPNSLKIKAVRAAMGNPTKMFAASLGKQFAARGVELTGVGFRINPARPEVAGVDGQPGTPAVPASLSIDVRGRPAVVPQSGAPARRPR